MTVMLPEQSAVSCRSQLQRRTGWVGLPAWALLILMLVGVPGHIFAQAAAPAEPSAEEPSQGAQAADLIVPVEFIPHRFPSSVEVRLSAGQSEIIETYNVTNPFVVVGQADPDSPNYDPTARLDVGRAGAILGIQFNVSVQADGTDPVEVIMVLVQGQTDAQLETEIIYERARRARMQDERSTIDDPISQAYVLIVDDAAYYTPGNYVPGVNIAEGETVFTGQNIFRDVLTQERGRPYMVTVLLDASRYIQDDTTAFLAVILRRTTGCSMNIRYAGDLSGGDFGELAYYNDFLKASSRFAAQGGVARATGSAVDEQVLRVADSVGLTGTRPTLNAGESAAMAGSAVDPFGDGYSAPPTCNQVLSGPNEAGPVQCPEPQSSNTDLENWVSGVDEVPREELETFGLTLAGVKGKSSKKLDPISAWKGVSASSTLEAASRVNTREFFGATASANQGYREIPLSRLTVRPNARFAEGKVPVFTWKEGDAGSAKLVLNPVSGGGLAGVIRAEQLSAENYKLDDGSIPVISVTATFVAAEGALGCQHE